MSAPSVPKAIRKLPALTPYYRTKLGWAEADGDRERMNPDNFWSGYLTELGYAANDHYRWNGLFRRDFECGLVLVNQPGMPTISVDLPDVFTDLDGQTVTSVTLTSSSGQVLRKSCASDSPPNAPTDFRIEG